MATTALAENETVNRLMGKTIAFSFDSGFAVEATYKSPSEMQWRANGRTGTETLAIASIAADVLFVSWTEQSGTTVSHVLDLARRRVWSYVTYSMGERRQGKLDQGTWRFLDPA